jgi:hypothetical protein
MGSLAVGSVFSEAFLDGFTFQKQPLSIISNMGVEGLDVAAGKGV